MSKRIFGLDILRAFAIIFVMLEHGRFLIPVELFPNKYFFFLKIFLDGVSLFFVLSGFLIGGILLKNFDKQEIQFHSLKDFWFRRWMRTLPNYFLVLSLLVGLSLFFRSGLPSETWQYYLFIQNFFSPHPAFFREAWSLSVEEWFYLLLPLTILIQHKLMKFSLKKAVFSGAVIFILLPMIIRLYSFYNAGVIDYYAWDDLFRKRVITRLDSLMFGVLAAYIHYYYADLFNKKSKLLFAIGVAILVFNKLFEIQSFGNWGIYSCVFLFTLNAAGTALLLPLLSSVKNGKGFLYKWITWISILSYSMYLLNLSVVQNWILTQFSFENIVSLKAAYILNYILFWIFTIGLSYLLYMFFEKPILNFRDRISNKRKTKLAA